MAMKKNISKALAMAVMMSVWCGSAYAAGDKVIISVPLGGYELNQVDGYSPEVRLSEDSNEACLWSDSLAFFSKGNIYAYYDTNGMAIVKNPDHPIFLNNVYGLEMGNLQITNVTDITASGTITAGTSGEIKSDETGLVNGAAVYTYLESQNYLTAQDIINKADKATTLAGYGITDGATKTELNAKADKAALDDEVKAREQGDADTLKKANEYTDQEIAKISGGASSEALEKLDSKINQTNDRVNRVGATAAALAAINYQPMAKGQSQVAVGMGGYKGKKATALGLAYQISDRISGSVAGAANGSEHMFNVGFNYLFGQHSDKDIAQIAAVPGSVSLKEAELQSEVEALKADNQAMQARMAQLEAMVKALAVK